MEHESGLVGQRVLWGPSRRPGLVTRVMPHGPRIVNDEGGYIVIDDQDRYEHRVDEADLVLEAGA